MRIQFIEDKMAASTENYFWRNSYEEVFEVNDFRIGKIAEFWNGVF